MRKIGLILLVLVVLLLVAGGIFFVIPAYQASESIKEAEALKEQGDFIGAAQLYADVVESNPGNERVLASLIDVLEVINIANAYEVLSDAAEAGVLPAQERARFIRIAYETNHPEVAQEWLAVQREAEPLAAETLFLNGLTYVREGDVDGAFDSFEQAIGINDKFGEAHLWMGRLMGGSPEPVVRLRAKQHLVDASALNQFAGLKALAVLLQSPTFTLTEEERVRFVERMSTHPYTVHDWQLVALQQQLALEPDRREEILDQAVQVNTIQDAFLVQWLNSVGAFERALEVAESANVEAEDLDESQVNPITELRYQSLVALERLDEAEELLVGEEGQEVDPLNRSARLSALARERGAIEEARGYWQDAYNLAEERGDPGPLFVLGQQAAQQSWWDEAFRAYRTAFVNDDFAERAPENVWMQYTVFGLASGGEAMALEATERALVFLPDNYQMINNRAYLGLLLNREEAWREAVNRLRENLSELLGSPNGADYANTLALAHLRTGNPEQALSLLEEEAGIDVDQISDSNKAVYAAVLAASGETDRAEEVAATIQRERVLDLEWNLVSGLVPTGSDEN